MTVAFIGHRNIERTQALRDRLTRIIEQLIINDSADTFLFGSRSEYNDLCYDVVTELMKTHIHIKRVFVRGEYENIDNSYREYLLTIYEETFFAPCAHGAGALSYIKRNRAMIDMCEVLVVYCDESYTPKSGTKSGTKIAIDYARAKKKRVINVCENKG